jgi:hypothetical protein
MRFLQGPKILQGGFHGVGGVVEDRIPRCCMSASSSQGATRGPSPHSPLALAVAGWTSGSPCRAADLSEELPDASSTLRFTFEAPASRRDAAHATSASLGLRPLVCASLPTCLRPSTPRRGTEVLPLSGTGCHTDASCSALVVSHHLDGLLRPSGSGLVASRSRM